MEAGPQSDKERLFVPVEPGLLLDLPRVYERRDPTSRKGVNVDEFPAQRLEVEILRQHRDEGNPASATAWSSSNITDRRDGLCENGIEKVPF
jgi:hypothetical protein